MVESSVTPQSCPLTVVKSTPETSPNKSADTPLKFTPDTTAEQDGNESSSSRTSGRSKKQTQFYGSPIRHAVKIGIRSVKARIFRWVNGLSVGSRVVIVSVSEKENESVQKEQSTDSEVEELAKTKTFKTHILNFVLNL